MNNKKKNILFIAPIFFDYYKEIIRNYRDISYELDMYKIEEYLSLYKNNLNASKIR